MARSAPRRRAVRTESMAVLPPPITATHLPKGTGVSESSLAASIRLTRVKYSLDDRMLMEFSPGMFMKFGSPAPEATNMPLNPSSSSCSTLNVLPMMQSLMNFTPIWARFSISTSTTLLGKRNSGIPYFNTPPISCSASNTVTSYPYFAMSPAKESPAGPEPITAILMPFFSLISGTEICPLSRS